MISTQVCRISIPKLRPWRVRPQQLPSYIYPHIRHVSLRYCMAFLPRELLDNIYQRPYIARQTK
jgi:hypothetical protein